MLLRVIRAIIPIFAFVLPSMGLEAATVSREVTVDPSQLTLESVQGSVFPLLGGAASALPEGAPDLPILPIHLALPTGSRISAVRVIPLEFREFDGQFQVGPVGPPRPEIGTPVTHLSPSIAASTTWYPADPVITSRDGMLRGRALAAVAVSPLQWIPREGRLRLMTRFRVEVDTEAAPAGSDLQILRESPAGRRAFEPLYRQLTGTVDGVLGAASDYRPLINSGEPFEPTFRPTVDGSPVEMVIITDAAQTAEYQRLADFKTQTGINTVVRTMNWIRTNYPGGVDSEERIRNFITDAAAKWGTTYVLLGGDTDVIPIRYGFTNFYGGENIPTDLYYSDLDRTWDGDGDGIFGEGYINASNPGDQVDLFPDVYIGRLTSRNPAEAQTLVDKTLLYESSPPLGHQNDFLFLGEVLFPQYYTPGQTILFDGADLCEDIIPFMAPHQNAVKLYENYPGYPGSVPETKSAVVDSINAGFGLVHHVGHGYINTMSVGINHETLINSDADAFVNGDATFLLYAINCTSAAVDFNCISERFLLNANGGAVAVVGSTRLDFPTTGRVYQDEFYELLLVDGIHEVGRAVGLARVPFVVFANQDNTHRWTQFTQIYLGDPSLHFWTDVPATLAVTHAPSFELGTGSYTVDVNSGGSPVDSALVTLFKDGDAHATALTNSSGQAVLPFHPDLTGDFSVGVIADDHIPYITTVPVVATAGAYLYAEDQLIDDDTTAPSNGNVNAVVDAGETIELGFLLRNGGGASESGITATLSTSDPDLSITDNLSFYTGSVAAGASISPSDRFLVTVPRSAPDRSEIHCTLDIFGSSGVYSQEVILYVHAPVFEYRHQALRDSIGTGDNDGVIEVNEDFAILPTLRNRGLGATRDLGIRLRSSDPAVTITDSTITVGTLAPGADFGASVDGLAARLSNVTEYHELRIVLVDAYGEIYSRLVEWTPPDTTAGLIAFGSASSIALTWSAIEDTTLWGYNVYRSSTELGTYQRVNNITTPNIAYYRDEQLPGLTRYYYKVAAVDSSGNEGPRSLVASATTSLPLHDSWPVEVQTATTSGITLADLDGDSTLEIMGGGEEIYALRADGNEFVNGDQDVRTLGPISKSGLQLFWNTPAVADIDGDGTVEIAAISWNDAKLYIVDITGTNEPGWPKTVNPQAFAFPNPLGSVVFANVDDDPDLEIFCTVADRIYAWNPDGTELIDGDSNPASSGVFAVTSNQYSYGTPTIVNLDSDPEREIVAGMRNGDLYAFNNDGSLLPGFPFSAGGDITSSPAVGDINGDGTVEIVFGSSNALLHAIRPDGTQAPGFPVGIQLTQDLDSSPALADLSGDGNPDIVIGASNGALFAFNGANGNILAGFPIQIRDNLNNKVPIRSSPVVADVDGDGFLDIVVGDQDGRLHGFTAAGGLLPGFPIQTGNILESSPAVWDIDGDGLTEVVVQSFDQHIYMWDTPWTFNESLAVWPMFKRNQRNTGVLDEAVFAVTAAPEITPPTRAALLQNSPNPLSASGTVLRYRVPEGATYQHVRLMLFDLNGRVVRTLLDGEQPPGWYEFRWDGRDDRGRDVSSGIYPYRLQVAGESLTRKMVVLR